MCFPHCFLEQLFTLFFILIRSVLSHLVQWLLCLFQHLQALLINLLCRLLFLLCAFHVDIPQGPITIPILFFPYKLPLGYHLPSWPLLLLRHQGVSNLLSIFLKDPPFIWAQLHYNWTLPFDVLKTPYTIHVWCKPLYIFSH